MFELGRRPTGRLFYWALTMIASLNMGLRYEGDLGTTVEMARQEAEACNQVVGTCHT